MKVKTEQTILIGNRVKVQPGKIFDDSVEDIPEGILGLVKKNSPAITILDGVPKPKAASVKPTSTVVEPKMKPAKPEPEPEPEPKPKKAPEDSKKKKPASEQKKKKLLKKRG